MNGYREYVLDASHGGTGACDEQSCEADAVMHLHDGKQSFFFCAEHMVERSCGWGCVTLDVEGGSHEPAGELGPKGKLVASLKRAEP